MSQRPFSRQGFASLGYAQYDVDATTVIRPFSDSPTNGVDMPSEPKPVEIHMRSTVDLRMRSDGTGPTSSLGMPILANEYFIFDGDRSNLRFCAATTAGKVDIEYYG